MFMSGHAVIWGHFGPYKLFVGFLFIYCLSLFLHLEMNFFYCFTVEFTVEMRMFHFEEEIYFH